MPAYNVERYIREAIDSILNQTFRDFEFIIVDDASTDHTLSIIESYKDDRIKIIRNETNLKLAASLNKGLKIAKGKYLARMDADDISHPERLAKLYQFMEKNPDIDICGTTMKLFGNEDAVWEYNTDDAEIKAGLIWGSTMPHGTVLMRLSTILKHNLFFDESFRLGQDWKYWFDVKDHVKFSNLKEELYYYRREQQNITVQFGHQAKERYSVMHQIMLTSLGIPFTSQELKLHQLVIGQFSVVPSPQTLREARAWLKKLLGYNRSIKAYDTAALEKISKQHWNKLFYLIVPYGFKTVLTYFQVSGVSFAHLTYYLKYVFNKLIGRNNTEKKKLRYQNIIRKHYGKKMDVVFGETEISDYLKFADVNRIRGFKRWRYLFKIARGYFSAYSKLFFALLFKRCYYGPFKGEFGNFLGHNLPFLFYLYSKGVKIYYCGMLLHQSLLVDESGKSIIFKYYGLRDFFREVSPGQNDTILPPDVQEHVLAFEREAKGSIYPFFNVGSSFYYWFIHRTWILNGFMRTPDLKKVYKTKDENSVVIFPRRKGASSTPSNGDPWDWAEVAKVVKPYFDKVYVMGHPVFSVPVEPFDNVEVLITDDNARILEKCSNSRLIINQHSGTCYLGEYTDTQVLVIFHGKFPISTMRDSIIFKEFLGTKYPLAFAFSLGEIEEYVKNFQASRQIL